MIPQELVDAVKKMNEQAEKGISIELTEQQSLLIRSHAGMLVPAGKAKYGTLYAIRDPEVIKKHREEAARKKLELEQLTSALKDQLVQDIRLIENQIAPIREEYDELMLQANERKKQMQKGRDAIVAKLVELRSMGYDGIRAETVSLPSLYEIEQRYGVRVKSWDQFLEMYLAGKFDEMDKKLEMQLMESKSQIDIKVEAIPVKQQATVTEATPIEVKPVQQPVQQTQPSNGNGKVADAKVEVKPIKAGEVDESNGKAN